MDKRTEIIKEMIDKNWKSRRSFAEHIGVPPTTLSSMLERGIGNASVDNVLKVCAGLGITSDELLNMAGDREGVQKGNSAKVKTIAAHIDDDVTEEELEDIARYIDFIKSQRKK